MLPGAVGEHSGEEVFPQHRIVEPAVFLHRQVRVLQAEGPGVDPAPATVRPCAVGVVDLDPLQAAGRRILHEDVAANFPQLHCHFLAVGGQRLCHVKVVIEGAQGFGLICTAHQPNRLAGYAQADGHFRADRDEIEVISEGTAA
ncbi:hypothetical protein D9M73_166020 [compost metagenome]